MPEPPASLPDQVSRRGIGSHPAATPVAIETASAVTVGATRSSRRTRAATAAGGPVSPSPVTLSGSRPSASVPSVGAPAATVTVYGPAPAPTIPSTLQPDAVPPTVKSSASRPVTDVENHSRYATDVPVIGPGGTAREACGGRGLVHADVIAPTSRRSPVTVIPASDAVAAPDDSSVLRRPLDVGAAWHAASSARAPVTCGAALDVPLPYAYPEPGKVDAID